MSWRREKTMAAWAVAALMLGQGPSSVAQPAPTPAAPARVPYVWPATLTNAKVMDANSGAERLRGAMLAFTSGLGVKCSFCHVGGDDLPLAERDFASDANPRKDVARAMMRMTWQLNRETLPAIAGLKEPAVSCYSCHGGRTKPLTAAEPVAPPAPPTATALPKAG